MVSKLSTSTSTELGEIQLMRTTDLDQLNIITHYYPYNLIVYIIIYIIVHIIK